MVDKTLYNENSICSLEARDFFRLRPATYLGSNEYSTQLVKEIFYNAFDEHDIGHGDRIIVTVDTDKNKYCVTDEGQGFPINVLREDGETVLQASFDVINTSGKFDDDGCYSGSAMGLNGIGSKLTNFLSKSLEVKSFNNNKREHLYFEDGLFVKREVTDCEDGSGTSIAWIPDECFFQNKSANISELKRLFREITCLSKGLQVDFTVDDKTFTYKSEQGLSELLDDKVKDKEIIDNRFLVSKKTDTGRIDVAMTFSADYNDDVTAYVNYGYTERGVHITIIRSLMTDQINKYALDKGFIKKSDDKFTSRELYEGCVLFFNIKSRDVKYDSQVKTNVVSFAETALLRQVIVNDFAMWLENNPKDAKMIIDRAMVARKAKDAAQKAKDNIRNASSGGKKFISLPTKLVDAYSKKRSECELFITEGDSAANGFKAKRDGATQAVFPIRGKILSCRKATPDKVYANQEISNIVKAIGLDIDKETGKLIYDTKKLRYGKIILATDADPDGYSIRMLLINMFWWLCPELVINGHICAAVPPLYRITNKKNEYLYLLDDKALADYKDKHKNESYLVNRMKGLGECDSDELATLLIRPATRQVEQIIVDNVKEADDMLECFMGDDVSIRREYLLAHV